MPSQPEDDEGEVTDDIPQIECLWPRIQRARCNFWKANTCTVKQIMGKVKRAPDSRRRRRREQIRQCQSSKKTSQDNRKKAMKRVNALMSLLSKETCAQVEAGKTENVFQNRFENVYSL